MGHSSSGSHERYKSKDRLAWEKEFDCNLKMRKWILENGISNESSLIEIENTCKNNVKAAKSEAWETYLNPILNDRLELIDYLNKISSDFPNSDFANLILDLEKIKEPNNKDLLSIARKFLRLLRK